MNFEIAKIVLPLEFREYHESLDGNVLYVWVNPPRAKRLEREEIIRRGRREIAKMVSSEQLPVSSDQSSVISNQFSVIRWLLKKASDLRRPIKADEQDRVGRLNADMWKWLSEIWSQYEDESTHTSIESIRKVYEEDPTMYQWMVRRTVEMMESFRAEVKKN